MLPLGTFNSKDRHPFSLLVFVGCSSGSNWIEMGFQVVVIFIDSFVEDLAYVRDVEVCV
jgi:hypothetical protein